MSDSWPMVARCKLAQWRAMDPEGQTMCAASWDGGVIPGACYSPGTPIWTSESGGRWLTLMSVKEG